MTDSFTSIIQVAERSGRTDLSTRLREHREDIRRTGVTIVRPGLLSHSLHVANVG